MKCGSAVGRTERQQNVSRIFFEGKKFVGYVLEVGSEIIGGVFAHEKVWWNNSEIFVEEMFIKPELQRRG